MALLNCYRIELSGAELRWFGPGETLIDQRPLQGVDELVVAVDKAFGDLLRPPNLELVGRLLFRWLDGQRQWLTGVCQQQRGFTLHLELGGRLHYLPWELCCDEGFLVEVAGQAFNPWHRVLDRRSNAIPPANRPLRILMIACSPENVLPVLDFEKEEEVILKATENYEIELVVEESGSLEGLAERLTESGAGYFDVLHLSGHAGVLGQQPVFLMEDFQGDRQDVTPEALAKALGFCWPRLVFLSGCETAQAPDQGQLPSFCESLVKAGASNVLGWSLPIGDHAAIQAAEVLYGQLAAGTAFDQAVCLTRHSIFNPEAKAWYLLRCYGDGSPLEAFVTPPEHPGRGELAPGVPPKQVLSAGDQIQACAPKSFIGRRRIIQACLSRLIAKPEQVERYHEGLILTGLGGLGKSSLAVHLCRRLHRFKPLAWFGRFDELGFFERLEAELMMPPQQDASLLQCLKRFLAPLTQPLLFVFDDFEQNGEVDAFGRLCFDDQGRMRIRVETQVLLCSLLEAIRECASASRVIITCRYGIVPPSASARLYHAPLTRFSGADLIKKVKDVGGFRRMGMTDIAVRALDLADGNPRLLETFSALLSDPAMDVDQLEGLLASLETAATTFREQTLLAQLLALLDDDCRLLLSKIALCSIPIPQSVIHVLADEKTRALGLDRAVNLGLVERNGRDPSQLTLYVPKPLTPLLAPLLSDEARRQAHRELAEQLYRCWWTNRTYVANQAVELLHHAHEAGQAAIVHEVTAVFTSYLTDLSRFREVRALCLRVLELGPDPAVLCQLGCAEHTLGEVDAAKQHLQEAIALGKTNFQLGQQLAIARALLKLAHIERQNGCIDRAETLCRDALDRFKQEGDIQGTASTLFIQGGLLADLGETTRAKALWEDALALHEQINDVQGKAGVLHALASLLAQGGELERAKNLWQASLDLRTRAGDVSGEAATLQKLGSLLAEQGDVRRAMQYWDHALKRVEMVGDVMGQSAILHNMAGALARQGDFPQALERWETALALKKKIGDASGAAVVLLNMGCVIYKQHGLAPAQQIWETALALFTHLDEAKGKASTLLNMAVALCDHGVVARSQELSEEALTLFAKTGDAQGKALVLVNLATLAGYQGQTRRQRSLYLQALPTLAEQNAWFDVLQVLHCLSCCLDHLAILQAVWIVIRVEAPLETFIDMFAELDQREGLDPRLSTLLATAVFFLDPGRKQNNNDKLNQLRTSVIGRLERAYHASAYFGEGLDQWMFAEGLHDPTLFLPRFSDLLEEAIGERWYFERAPLMGHPFTLVPDDQGP